MKQFDFSTAKTEDITSTFLHQSCVLLRNFVDAAALERAYGMVLRAYASVDGYHVQPDHLRQLGMPMYSDILFFERHGGKSVFIGRFFGPIRAVIPLAAGIMQMPRGRFWFANVTSALVWAPMLLFVGDAAGEVGDHLIGSTNTVLLVFGGLTLIGIAGAVWAALRAVRSKP